MIYLHPEKKIDAAPHPLIFSKQKKHHTPDGFCFFLLYSFSEYLQTFQFH
jgi:hypothetical protein